MINSEPNHKWKSERNDWAPWFAKKSDLNVDSPQSTWSQTTSRRSRELCITVDNESVQPLLTPQEGSCLDEYLSYLKREVKALDSRVTGIEVSGFGIGDTSEIVITISIAAPSGDAMQFWDKLGARIETWLQGQSDYMRSVVSDQFAIDVRWQSDSL